MKKEEMEALMIKKESEGKSYKQIKSEFLELNNFQNEMKSDKKLIVNLQKEIDKRDKKIKSLEKKAFTYGLEMSPKQSKEATIRELNRIIALVSDDRLPKSEIRALCNIDKGTLECALTFLLRNNLIEESKTGGTSFYVRKLQP